MSGGLNTSVSCVGKSHTMPVSHDQESCHFDITYCKSSKSGFHLAKPRMLFEQLLAAKMFKTKKRRGYDRPGDVRDADG
jgi:hypothetical protein